jgi:hypothetical protein
VTNLAWRLLRIEPNAGDTSLFSCGSEFARL